MGSLQKYSQSNVNPPLKVITIWDSWRQFESHSTTAHDSLDDTKEGKHITAGRDAFCLSFGITKHNECNFSTCDTYSDKLTLWNQTTQNASVSFDIKLFTSPWFATQPFVFKIKVCAANLINLSAWYYMLGITVNLCLH